MIDPLRIALPQTAEHGAAGPPVILEGLDYGLLLEGGTVVGCRPRGTFPHTGGSRLCIIFSACCTARRPGWGPTTRTAGDLSMVSSTARLLTAVVVLIAATTVGCKTAPSPKPAVPAATASHAVVAGESNAYFTAESPQKIKLADGVKGIPKSDSNGRTHSLSFVAQKNNTGVGVSCQCPAGCVGGDGLPGMSLGCVLETHDGNTAWCSGDCTASDHSCTGCRMVTQTSTSPFGVVPGRVDAPPTQPSGQPRPEIPNTPDKDATKP